jgi:hypothetical protein
MYTDLKELRVRLQCHLDLINYEDDKVGEKGRNPLGPALLSAIELLQILEANRTAPVEAWRTRQRTGTQRPRGA